VTRSAGSSPAISGPLGAASGRSRVDIGEGRIACAVEVGALGREHLLPPRERRQCGIEVLASFHHVEQVVLERGLAPGERRDLVLQALELLRGYSPGREALVVALGPGQHGLDLFLEASLVIGDVVELSLQLECFVAQLRDL